MLATNPDAFVNIVSSGLALAPRIEAAVYCATKAGLSSFARSLRCQCSDAGLAVAVSETVMTRVQTSLSPHGGSATYLPARAAADTLAGIAAGQSQIWVEKTRLLRRIHRVSPALAYRLLRGPRAGTV